MADQKHELQRVAAVLVGDIEKGSKSAAEKLLGEQGGPDGEKATRAEVVAHLRALWPYPDLRAQFFARMIPAIANPHAKEPDGSDAEIPARNGVANVEELIAEAFPFGHAGDPPPMPPPVPESPLNAEVAATQQVVEPPTAGLTEMAL